MSSVVRPSKPPRRESVPPTGPRSSETPIAPRKRKKLRKEEIVVEATSLFAERGYEGASMGDLAERVGLRKASLFHHFPSKDVLYATVLTHLLDSVKTAIFSAAQTEGTYCERLDRLTDTITTTLGAQPHTARLLVREALDWGPVMREHLGTTVKDILAAALEFAREGQREGVFDEKLDATQLIVSLVGIHFMPFAIPEIIEHFTGSSPFVPEFIEQRRQAVREQLQRLAIKAR